MRRFVCVALAFACTVAPLAAGAADAVPDVTALRAKMKAARGPAPDNYRETVTAGAYTVRTFKIGDDIRTIEDDGGTHRESGTFKGEDWHQNANGLTVVDEPDPLAVPSMAKGTPKDTGTVSMSDGMLVLTDVDEDGIPTREFIDPATWLPARFEAQYRSGTETTTYESYAKFGDQTLPARWTIATPIETLTYTRVERVGGGATAALVAEPGTRRLLVDFPADKPVQIPARFDEGRVYVQTTIAGRAFEFLLDSGSAGILIDAKAAQSLGLPLLNRHVNGSNARPQDEFDTTIPEIRIGDLTMHNIVASAQRITAAKNDTTHVFRESGLLGFDFFATIGLTIDYEHKKVIATPFAAYKPPGDPATSAIDIRLSDQVPMITVVLDGTPASRFVIDTGDDVGAYTVYDYFMDRHPRVGERSGDPYPVNGVGGQVIAHAFYVHSFKLGTMNFVDFGGYSMGGGSYDVAQDGTIGTGFLLLYNVDFDYPHGRVYFTPTTNTKQMLHIH